MAASDGKQADAERIKEAARGRWVEILSTIGGCPGELLTGRHGPCPRCGGIDRFRLIDADAGALFCNACFSTRNGDGLAALQWLRGWTFNDALNAVADFLGVKLATKKSKASASSDGVYASPRDAIRHCLPVLLMATGKKWAAAGVSWPAKPDQPKPVKAWHYSTFSVIRIDLPTPPGQKRWKEFRPLHQVPLSDGRPAWRFGYPPGPRPIYRLAELQATEDSSLAVIVGGEKAADAAAELGLVATTCAGGEKAVAHTDWAPLARFRQVVVAIDNDPAGHEYGDLVVKELARIKPDLAVRVLLLPGLPEKGDIVEWIAAGGTKAEFLKLAAEAAPPDPIAHDRAVCEAIKIDVLGELPDRRIKAFSETLGKTVEIVRPSFMTYPDLLQYFGPIIREKVSQAKEVPPGMLTLQQIQQAIAVVGGAEKAGSGIERGLGVWQGEDGKIVLVGPGQAAVWDGAKLELHRRPRVAGIKVDMDHPPESRWFCPGPLAKYLEAAADRDWCVKVIDELTSIFLQWNWRLPPGPEAKSTIADLLPGLTLATWVQTCWSWRPMVGIAAASDSGKTTLFEVLETLYGPLALLNSKSTEAGLRQTIANHATVILCDEFENDGHRQRILEYFRTASKGSQTLRGTSGQAKGVKYGLQHICWCTAVELGLRRAPDRNRFIILDLDPPPKGKRGKLMLPSTPELRDLGQKLLAIAVRYVGAAEVIASRIKSTQVEGVHGRVIESFAAPVGILAAVLGMDEASQDELLKAVLAGVDTDPVQGVKDETDLLGEILSSTVDLGRGDRASVAQILNAPGDYPGGWDALERVGIAPIATTRGQTARKVAQEFEGTREFLFLAHKSILRYLLKGTPWESQSIDQILKRLPGACRDQQRVGGHRPWGIKLPWELIREKYLADQNSSQEF